MAGRDCGCGKGGPAPQLRSMSLGTSGRGAYPLSSFPNCEGFYVAGPWAGSSIYVVARMTDDERLFPRTQLVEASTLARSLGATIENVPTSALCPDAVASVYG